MRQQWWESDRNVRLKVVVPEEPLAVPECRQHRGPSSLGCTRNRSLSKAVFATYRTRDRGSPESLLPRLPVEAQR